MCKVQHRELLDGSSLRHPVDVPSDGLQRAGPPPPRPTLQTRKPFSHPVGIYNITKPLPLKGALRRWNC